MPLQHPVPVPSKGAVPPRPVVSVSLQQPGKKAVVNRGQASIVKRSQVASVTPEPPRRPAPVPSKRATSLRFPSDKARPLIEVVAARCRPSVVSTTQSAAAEAHQGAAASTKTLRAVALQQSGDLMSLPSPNKAPVTQESTQVKRTVETAPKGCSAEHPIIHQGRSFLGEEGEERQACITVVNVIKNAALTPCSPEAMTTLMVAKPLAPRSTSDKADLVVVLCQLLDERLPPVREAPRRLGTMEAAQKHSPPFVVPAVGGPLARAAAYIQERVNRRSPPCEEFGSQALKGPPDKAEAGPKGPRQPVEVVIGEVGANIVSSPMFKHERADRPSRLEAEGICRTPAPGKAYMPPHSSPRVAPLLLKLTFGVPRIDLKRGGRKPFTEAARPCQRSDEHSFNGREPFGWAPDGPKPLRAVVDQWPSTGAISGLGPSMEWCSPSALAAPTLRVIPFSRPEQAWPFQRVSHELHQHKPPSAAGILERGENKLSVLRQRWASSRCWHWLFRRALPMMAIKTSAVRSSCIAWVAYCMPPVPPSVVLPQVKSPCHLCVGLIWRARYKMPVVPPGAAHDIVRQWVEARVSCYRSFLVIQRSEVHICQVRCEQLNTLNTPRRYGVSTVNRYAYTSAIKRSPPSGTTSMPPVWSRVVAMLLNREHGASSSQPMSLVPVVPTGAVRGILGKQTSTDAPRSRSFPVICQLADDSRRYKAVHHTPPVLPPVVSLRVESRRCLGNGLVWRARDKVPDTLGTSR